MCLQWESLLKRKSAVDWACSLNYICASLFCYGVKGVSFFLRCQPYNYYCYIFCFLKLFHSFINHLLSVLQEKGKGTDTHSSIQQIFIESILYRAFCKKMDIEIEGAKFKQLYQVAPLKVYQGKEREVTLYVSYYRSNFLIPLT